MTKPANIEAIETATHTPWKEWLSYFESIKARELPHKQVAAKAYEKMDEKQASRGWWSQSVAVAYEQHIGRRQPGQRSDGSYEVTISQTYHGTLDEALNAWVQLAKNNTDFLNIPVSGLPVTSKTDKWRHWRVGLTDGSRINVTTFQKTPEKASLAVTITKLKESKDVEKWRSYWREFLASMPGPS